MIFMKKVSILIAAKNEEKNISRLFESLRKITYPKRDYEVVLLDDNSTDNTPKIARKYGARVVLNKQWRGRGRARNLALKAAKYDTIAWIDADTEIVDKDWMQQMLEHLKGKVVGVAGSHAYPSKGSLMQKAVWHIPGMHIEVDKPKEQERAPTTSSMFLKKPLLEVGGYDESLTTGEDLEICWRLSKKGWKFVQIPNARIIHHYRPSPLKFFKQQVEYGSEGAKMWRQKLGLGLYAMFLGFLLAFGFALINYTTLALQLIAAALLFFHFALRRIYFVPLVIISALKHERNPAVLALLWFLEFVKNIAVILGFLKGLFSKI